MRESESYPGKYEKEPKMAWFTMRGGGDLGAAMKWIVQGRLDPEEFDEERRWLWRYIQWAQKESRTSSRAATKKKKKKKIVAEHPLDMPWGTAWP